MGTITATPDAANARIRVQVDASDDPTITGLALKRYPAGYDVNYYRPPYVRGSSPLLSYSGAKPTLPYVELSAGKATWYDYEAPIGQAVLYGADFNGGTPAYTRINWINNPDFETDTSGWQQWTGSTLARSTVTPIAGTASATVTVTTAGTVGLQTSNVTSSGYAQTVDAGLPYSASMLARTSVAGRNLQVGMTWLDATGRQIGATIYGAAVTSVAGTVHTLTILNKVAPDGAYYVSLFAQVQGTALNEVYYFDNVIMEQAKTVGAYTYWKQDVPAVPVVPVQMSAQVTLPAQAGIGWLKDPQRPGNNIKINCASFALSNPSCDTGTGVYLLGLDPRAFAVDAQSFDVPGSARGSSAYNVRKDFTSALRLISRSLADRDALEALLAPGAPLLLQLPPEYGERDQYIQVGAAGEGRIHGDHRVPWRSFSLPYVVQDAPEGQAQGPVGARWRDLPYATWTDLKATGKTYAQLGTV